MLMFLGTVNMNSASVESNTSNFQREERYDRRVPAPGNAKLRGEKKTLVMQNFMAYSVHPLLIYSPRGAYFIFLVTFLHSNMWDNKMFTYLGNKFYILLYWGWGGQLSKIFSLKECLVFTLQGPGATGAWLLSISWLVYVIIHSLSPRFSRHLHVSFCSSIPTTVYWNTGFCLGVINSIVYKHSLRREKFNISTNLSYKDKELQLETKN